MKLRNKKTGEIKTIEEIIREAIINNELETLKRIDDNWEDYNPKEPLIKDEKIRKAVRAWAEANKATIIRCYQNTRASGFSYENLELGVCTNISFIGDGIIDKRLNNNSYTIAELCGEEEE